MKIRDNSTENYIHINSVYNSHRKDSKDNLWGSLVTHERWDLLTLSLSRVGMIT